MNEAVNSWSFIEETDCVICTVGYQAEKEPRNIVISYGGLEAPCAATKKSDAKHELEASFAKEPFFAELLSGSKQVFLQQKRWLGYNVLASTWPAVKADPTTYCLDGIEISGGCLRMVIENKSVLEQITKGWDASFQVYSGSRVFASSSVHALQDNLVNWFGQVALDDIARQVQPADYFTLKMRLVLSKEEQQVVLGPLGRKSQKQDSFQRFAAAFYVSEDVVFIPDESAEGEYVLRTVGCEADASQEPYAREKKNRPIRNNVLLKSLSAGAGCAIAAGKQLQNGTLHASVFVNEENVPFARCTSCEEEFEVDLSKANDLIGITLLNEGSELLELTVEAQQDKSRKLILEQMYEFDELCRANDIEYFLAYGTLLGAIRHGGFIPWDNDADFFMTEQNYLKLRKVIDEGRGPANRILDDWMTVLGYPGSFGRYMDTESTQLDYDSSRGQGGVGGFGLVTDVFYLLPLKGTPEERQKKMDTFLAYDELANQLHRSKGTRTDSAMARYEELHTECEERCREEVLEELRSQIFFQPEEGATHWMSTASSVRQGEVFEDDWLNPLEYPLFGRTFTCPSGYLEMLRIMYGPNFRKYPANRSFPGKARLESQDIPYRAVEAEYLDLVDSDAVLAARAELKEMEMQETIRRRQVSPTYYRIDAMRLVQELLHDNEQQVLLEGSYEELYNLYRPYYEMQLSSPYQYWPVLVPLPDDMMAAALEALLCYAGETGDALAIAAVRNELGGGAPFRATKTYSRAA